MEIVCIEEIGVWGIGNYIICNGDFVVDWCVYYVNGR